jgi:pseudouridylate synthase
MSALKIGAEVQEALDARRPIVALESTIISHGLPADERITAAREFEQLLRDSGATPATIAVLDGVPHIGIDDADIELLAADGIAKASVRDLPIVVALGRSAATTVAATAHLAAAAGIRVFATGGLGGVHRGANESFDESADLPELGRTPVAVVCAGVKSILDIGATLERLETLSVPLVGLQTDVFPSFWLRESEFKLDWRVEDAAQIADVLRAQDGFGHSAGLVVANPVPVGQQWDRDEHDRVVQEALADADAKGIVGKAVTPFLLGRIVELSGGRSLAVNLDLVRNNIRVAAAIATAYAG